MCEQSKDMYVIQPNLIFKFIKTCMCKNYSSFFVFYPGYFNQKINSKKVKITITKTKPYLCVKNPKICM